MAELGRCIEHAELTNVGMRRQNNQDAFGLMVASDDEYWESRGHLFLVCDGMGAHAAGELASKMAADSIPHTYSKSVEMLPPVALHQAIVNANQVIYTRGMTNQEFRGMGTTCSTLLLLPDGAVVGHVGDSRVYRLRDNKLEQLSFDHSLAWEARAASKNKNDKALDNLPKNIITRSLGPGAQVRVDIEGPLPVRAGDKYLLCSDGLTGPVSDVELGTLLGCLSPEDAVQSLVDMANLRGGPDNITVVIAEVVDEPEEEPDEDEGETSYLTRWRWIVAGMAVILGVGLGIAGMMVPAVLSGVAAVVFAIMAFSRLFRREEGDAPRRPVQPSGKAPYATFDCRPGHEVNDSLSTILGQLREVATEMRATLDWMHLEGVEKLAARAVDAGNYSEAIARNCQAMCYIVSQIKQGRGSSDSDINLI